MSSAKRYRVRAWAIESAGGLGYLLAEQLVGAGERVLDGPATLAVRVGTLASGRSDKTDSNGARSVAIAALGPPALRSVAATNHVEVVGRLAKRKARLGRFWYLILL